MLQYQPSDALSRVIGSIQHAVAADKIFLLGEKYSDNTVNSIFSPGPVSDTPATSYYLLLLTRIGETRSDDVIMDTLEQRNRLLIPINLIVAPAKNFYQWLKQMQPFALRVIRNAPKLYDAGITAMPVPDENLREEAEGNRAAEALNACKRSCSFLAGAELYLSRQEYSLCAFLCHQVTEHACLSFLMRHIGLKTGTHNIDKLLRYSSMVCDSLEQIFPRSDMSSKQLFTLLQRAYIHSRYKEYEITECQAYELIERARKIVRIVSMEISELMRA